MGLKTAFVGTEKVGIVKKGTRGTKKTERSMQRNGNGAKKIINIPIWGEGWPQPDLRDIWLNHYN